MYDLAVKCCNVLFVLVAGCVGYLWRRMSGGSCLCWCMAGCVDYLWRRLSGGSCLSSLCQDDVECRWRQSVSQYGTSHSAQTSRPVWTCDDHSVTDLHRTPPGARPLYHWAPDLCTTRQVLGDWQEVTGLVETWRFVVHVDNVDEQRRRGSQSTTSTRTSSHWIHQPACSIWTWMTTHYVLHLKYI